MWKKYMLLHTNTKWHLNQWSGKYNCLTLTRITCCQRLDCPAFHRSPSWWIIHELIREIVPLGGDQSKPVLFSSPSCHPFYLSPPHRASFMSVWRWNKWNAGRWMQKPWCFLFHGSIMCHYLLSSLLLAGGARWSQSTRVRILCRHEDKQTALTLCMWRRGAAVKWRLDNYSTVTGRSDPVWGFIVHY